MTLTENKPKLGLALGGGGALGWSHIGVIQVLQEEGIRPDIVTGTSIGSLVGACYVAGKFEELQSIAQNMTRLTMIKFADVQIGKNGFLRGDPVVRELRTHLGEQTIENLDRRFGAMAVDLVAGTPVPFTSGDLVEAVRASISIPGVFTPIRKGEQLLVDGGLLDNVPVSLAHQLGADKVIGVNIAADYEGRAASSGVLTAAPTTPEPSPSDQSLPRAKQAFNAFSESISKYFRKGGSEPSMLGISLTSIALIMRELGNAQDVSNPADVMLKPKLGHITMIEFDRADEMIELGRSAATCELANIKALIA